jgi:hypothetical protein
MYCKNSQGRNPLNSLGHFLKIDDFINSFWLNLTFRLGWFVNNKVFLNYFDFVLTSKRHLVTFFCNRLDAPHHFLMNTLAQHQFWHEKCEHHLSNIPCNLDFQNRACSKSWYFFSKSRQTNLIDLFAPSWDYQLFF